MKKLFSGVLVCVCAFLATGCGFQSEETNLTGNLVTFTAEGENKDDILIGVKEKSADGLSDRVIVTPARYQNITADANVVICRVSDFKLEAYRAKDGDPIGRGIFDTFTKIPTGNSYIGTKYKTLTYYFPAQGIDGKTVQTKVRYEGLKNLFLQNGANWEVLDYDGNLIWQAPAAIWLIKDSKAVAETFYITVPEAKKNGGCVLYEMTGKQLKKITANRWRIVKKQLKNLKPLSSNANADLDSPETSVYAEIEGIKKF